jgi:hypothetical protein
MLVSIHGFTRLAASQRGFTQLHIEFRFMGLNAIEIAGQLRQSIFQVVAESNLVLGRDRNAHVHMTGIKCPSTIWHSFCFASAWKIGPS